jgi:hypothetical protein
MKKIICLLALLVLSACASKGDWGDYSDKLYTYYKDATPQQRDALARELSQIFEAAERKGRTPPPGLFAEYGTLMLQAGAPDRALEYYQKEKDNWPESAIFMDSLISAVAKHVDDAASGDTR